LRQEPGVLSDIFAFYPMEVNFNAGGQAEVVSAQAVSGNYYTALGVPALIGRTLTDADDNLAATPVVVLSHRFWASRFNGDPAAVGKQVNINNVAFTIAGVTPAGFTGTSQVGTSQDVSFPIAWEPQINGEQSNFQGAGVWWLRMMGRSKPGATAAQAEASLAGPFQQSVLEHRALRKTDTGAALRTLDQSELAKLGVESGSQGEMNMRRWFAPALRLLAGVVGVVLLIACANVANLLLVRASSRRKEIAVRLAVGASRWRLVKQLLTESVLLAAVGGALGVLFAFWIKDGLLIVTDWGGRGMSALTPRLDLRVLGFTLGLSFLAGIVFGILPALRATNVDLTPALKDTGRSSSGIGRSWLSKSLVVVQVSLSVLLLIGAGLLIRTLRNLQHVDMGFNANNVLLFKVDPSLLGYRDEKLADLYQRAFSLLEAVPGVQAVTFSRSPLLANSSWTSAAYLPGEMGANGQPRENDVKMHSVRENFFNTMEIPLLLGRGLTEQDDARAPRVAVINQAFAKAHFGNENPIGKRFGFDPEKPDEIEIVGVARDAKY